MVSLLSSDWLTSGWLDYTHYQSMYIQGKAAGDGGRFCSSMSYTGLVLYIRTRRWSPWHANWHSRCGTHKRKKKTGSDVELAWEKSRTLSAFDSNYIAGLDPWLFKSQMKKNNYNFSIIQSDWKKIIKKGRISACKRACACSFRSLLELPSVPCPL